LGIGKLLKRVAAAAAVNGGEGRPAGGSATPAGAKSAAQERRRGKDKPKPVLIDRIVGRHRDYRREKSPDGDGNEQRSAPLRTPSR
jgi:hypothetical protein